jgi:hypothetical protein
MVEATGIYICPSCQAVVKGAAGGAEGLVCHECGHEFGGKDEKTEKGRATKVPVGRNTGKSSSIVRNLTARKGPPVLAVEKVVTPPVAAKSSPQAQPESDHDGRDEEILMPDGSRRVRRRKRRKKDEKNKGLVLFLLGWFAVVVIILAMFKMGKGSDGNDQDNDQAKAELAGRKARDLAVMRRLLPEIGARFNAFLFQKTINDRKQFIDRSADLSFTFSRHYENSVFPVPENRDLRRIGQNVLSFLEDDIAIETIWEDEKGLKWGAVHVFDKVESWKLDWEAFGPSSSEPWARFRANLGSKEGVFRLLVRKRLSSNEEDSFFVNFYRAPQVFETENEYKNTQSPEVELKSDSAIGRQFLKLWEDYQEGRFPYGSILAPQLDPRGHMRITVRLAWEEKEEGKEEMVLKEIQGVGWFGSRIQEFHAEEMKRATDEATEKLTGTSGEEES